MACYNPYITAYKTQPTKALFIAHMFFLPAKSIWKKSMTMSYHLHSFACLQKSSQKFVGQNLRIDLKKRPFCQAFWDDLNSHPLEENKTRRIFGVLDWIRIKQTRFALPLEESKKLEMIFYPLEKE